jgi:ComF family protein
VCGDFQAQDQLCQQCSKLLPHYKSLRSWATFEGTLREAIHKFKYERDLTLGDLFARPMIELVNKMNWQIGLVTPVPLSQMRFAERGYNQSAFLARPIALGIKSPYSSKALKRDRDTQAQVGLNAEERRNNVADAFSAETGLVFQKNVLVVDDVTTTGSTIDACAAALIQAGAKNVYGLTLARAVLT